MFDIGKWLGRLMETKNAYVKLRKYVEDKDALSAYKRNLQNLSTIIHSEESESLAISDGELLEMVGTAAQNDLYDAIGHYTSLMVVTAVTYVENMFSEFFYEKFVAHPKSMCGYITGEDAKAKGYVKLTEILDEPDMDALVRRLSLRAAKIASNGSAKEVMGRITKLSNRSFNISADCVQEIMNKRHQIIHEGKQFWIDEIDIDATYDTLHALLKELALACVSAKIPYKDPGFIIDPMPVHTGRDNLHSG